MNKTIEKIIQNTLAVLGATFIGCAIVTATLGVVKAAIKIAVM